MTAPEGASHAPAAELLPLTAIRVSRTNPRKHFAKLGMEELTTSVRKHGVIQPVLVRPLDGAGYELIAGERRYRAAKAAGLDTLPALVRTLTDVEALELQVIENLQREDLHELEEAEGYEQLLKCTDAATGKRYDVDTIAAKVGKSRAYVYARLKLTALEPKAREAFYADKLNASTALLLARIPTAPLQLEALQDITQGRWRDGEPMSFREASRHVHEKFMLRLDEAPFATGDAKLLPSAGACVACPKRTGNQPELFADVKSGDVCTDPSCFAEKKAINLRLQREDARANGRTVIAGAAAKKILPYDSDFVAAGSGFVKLDQRCYDDAKQRTYAQILGKDAPAPTLVEHPESGAMVKVLPLAEIMQTLKGKGVAKQSAQRIDARADERARDAKARLETKVRQAILEQIHAQYTGQMSVDDGRLIAREFYSCTSHEYRKRIVNLWSPPEATAAGKKSAALDADYRRLDKFEKQIETLDAPAIARLLLELALVSQIHVGPYHSEPATELNTVAARVGVDAAQIRRELTAAAREAAKAKKPAAKKAPRQKRPTAVSEAQA